jgi:hypothetical protein
VLSGIGHCDGPIPRPEESYRLWCEYECDQVQTKTLYTYCEQVGRRENDYETNWKECKSKRSWPNIKNIMHPYVSVK